jgi:hypothetical protein
MERPNLTHLTAPVLAAVVLAGCGLSDPYRSPQSRPSSSVASTAAAASASTTSTAADAGDPPPERDGTITRQVEDDENRVSAEAVSATPHAAVLRYTNLYVNWRAGQLIANQRKLAQISIGAARLQARQAAARASADTQLTTDHVSNTGQIVSADPGSGPATGKWVIVTSEKTIGTGDYQGLPAAIHVTYATLTHVQSGWVVSQWSPQT